ncbi:MAG: CRISPR-associated endonuclease Cas2 [Pseudomonadota bacterium]
MSATQDTIAWAIAYDISDNRARARMAKRLEKVAVCVQGSVFEARLTQKQAQALFDHLSPLVDRGDSLRFYALPKSSLDRSMTTGGSPLPEDGPYWIL